MSADGIFPRVIAPDAMQDGDEIKLQPMPTRRGFDYAALVRRAYQRALAEQSRVQPGAEPRSATSPPEQDGDKAPEAWPAAAHPDPYPDDEHAQQRRLDALATPFVAALAAQQAHLAQLMHFLATRIADFCSDRAIVASGHWSAQLRLDAALLPDCTLHLTLSHFELALRFEARDPAVRQLICAHQAVLKRQLETLLDALDSPREVSVTA
jgi:type III secretion control protein HpaP